MQTSKPEYHTIDLFLDSAVDLQRRVARLETENAKLSAENDKLRDQLEIFESEVFQKRGPGQDAQGRWWFR